MAKHEDPELARITEERLRRGEGAEIVVDPGPNEEEYIDGLVSRIPANQGWYGKVYKRFPVPKEYEKHHGLLVLHIPQPELLDDLESDLLRFGTQYNWTDGLYEIMFFQHGIGEARRRRTMSLSFPHPAGSPLGGAPQLLPPLQNQAQATGIADLLKTMKDVAPGLFNPTPGKDIDPAETIKAVTEAYRLGAEAADKGRKEQPSPFDLIKATKELLPASTPSSSSGDVLAGLKDIATLVVPLIVEAMKPKPAAPQVDFLDVMVKLKQAGLLPENRPAENPLKVLGDAVSVMTPLIDRLGGGGGGDGGPWYVELAKAFAPAVVDVASAVKTAVANRAAQPQPVHATIVEPTRTEIPQSFSPTDQDIELPPGVRSEWSARTAQTPPGSTMPPPAAQPPAQGPQAPPEIPEAPVLPIFATIRAAAEAKDPKFYPRLGELLSDAKVMGEEDFDKLIEGTITPEEVLRTVAPWGGKFFLTQPALDYMKSFIEWERKNQETQFVVTCPKCNQQFGYKDMAEFQEFPTCGECGSALPIPVTATEMPEAPPPPVGG